MFVLLAFGTMVITYVAAFKSEFEEEDRHKVLLFSVVCTLAILAVAVLSSL